MRYSGWFIILFFQVFFSRLSYAQSISSDQLIEAAKDNDTKIIEYQGEVVGPKMLRGDFGWIHVHDGANALGVWASREQLVKLNSFGDYRHRGDWIKLTARFNRSCLEHGGDLDLHALSLEVIRPGDIIRQPITPGRYQLIAMLVLILSGLSYLRWYQRRGKMEK